MNIPDTLNPTYACGENIGTVEHFLHICQKHDLKWKIMVNTIMAVFKEAGIPPEPQFIGIPTLLGDNGHLP